MVDGRRWLRLAAGCTAWAAVAAFAQPALAATEFSRVHASGDAQRVVDWVLKSGDARGKPFAVVDKHAAQLYVFDRGGHLAGHTPAILGSAVGDRIAPGVGDHAQTGHVPFAERTTPAGRFEAEPGRNAAGERIVWVDYASAFAIHRLRPGAGYRTRAARLATSAPQGKRLSWGCVVVPVPVYDEVVARVLGTARSVVYVLPETRPVQSFVQALGQS